MISVTEVNGKMYVNAFHLQVEMCLNASESLGL